jgi:hypothetical protein
MDGSDRKAPQTFSFSYFHSQMEMEIETKRKAAEQKTTGCQKRLNPSGNRLVSIGKR